MPFNTDTPKRHSCRGGPQGVRPASAVGRPEDVARGLLPPDGREVDAGLGDVVGLAVGVALGGLAAVGFLPASLPALTDSSSSKSPPKSR